LKEADKYQWLLHSNSTFVCGLNGHIDTSCKDFRGLLYLVGIVD